MQSPASWGPHVRKEETVAFSHTGILSICDVCSSTRDPMHFPRSCLSRPNAFRKPCICTRSIWQRAPRCHYRRERKLQTCRFLTEQKIHTYQVALAGTTRTSPHLDTETLVQSTNSFHSTFCAVLCTKYTVRNF